MSSQPESQQYIPFTEMERLREGREIIRQESQVLADLARRIDMSFCAAVERLEHCRGSVVVTGMGKAGVIARKITATLSSTGTRAQFLHPAEAVHGDVGCVGPGDVVLALSNSGETDEICKLIPILRRIGASIVAITAKETSTLGSAADVTVTIGTIGEAGHFGMAPTSSTTAMLAVGDALALVASRARGFTRQQFAVFHPAGSLGQQMMNVRDVMRQGDQLRIAPQEATIREVFVGKRKPGRRTGAVMLVDQAGRLAGVFTDSDLARLLETRRDHQLDRPIVEVMTSRPRTIMADALLSEAVDLLSRHHISELPVVDAEEMPIGLIDITDVISLMPEQLAD